MLVQRGKPMVGNRLLPPGYRATVDRLSNFLEVPGLGFPAVGRVTSVKTVNDSVCLDVHGSNRN